MQPPSLKKKSYATHILTAGSCIFGMCIKEPVTHVWQVVTQQPVIYPIKRPTKKKSPAPQRKRILPRDASRFFTEADALFGANTDTTSKTAVTYTSNPRTCLLSLSKMLLKKKHAQFALFFYPKTISLHDVFDTNIHQSHSTIAIARIYSAKTYLILS